MAGRILDRFVGNFIFVPLLLYSEPLSRSEVKADFTTQKVPNEKWGYVTVRPHAHMFWWFYGAQTIPKDRLKFPLVIWIQGGPGESGCGFGNFEEIGPLDVHLKPRNSTWLKKANLLFIDNPVGTGYSYVTDDKAYTTNVSQIAEDLLTLLKTFMNILPVFQRISLYIFSESYGGKMTAAFGYRLYEAVRKRELVCRFEGVGLGGAWISPVDSVKTWGPYLYQFNLLDRHSLDKVMAMSHQTVNAVNAGQYRQAINFLIKLHRLILSLTNNVDFDNALKHKLPFQPNLSLIQLMNGQIKKKLGIPKNVTWGAHEDLVRWKQAIDFMKPVTEQVSKLLQNAVPVAVYQGQLDVICNTPGAERWITKLNWSGLNNFLPAERKPLYLKGDSTKNTAAFLKEYSYLKFYYILKAGHRIPMDAGEMALEMLGQVIQALSRRKV